MIVISSFSKINAAYKTIISTSMHRDLATKLTKSNDLNGIIVIIKHRSSDTIDIFPISTTYLEKDKFINPFNRYARTNIVKYDKRIEIIIVLVGAAPNFKII